MSSSAASDAADARVVVRAICGPTAAGKSAIAMRLAERHGLAIVAADSRQVYRGFDIGTAKPTHAERDAVPHYGIDVAEPTERYSAARWVESFDPWCDDVRANGREAVVVGGTGLYLRALHAPLFEEPPLDADARADLARELDTLDTEALRERVRSLDPARAHLGRTQLLRSIEVAVLTGEPISTWHARAARTARHRVRYLVVDPGRDVLRDRIARRTDEMLAGGWIDEVRALMGQLPDDAPAWKGTGYETLRQHVRGEMSLADARDRVVVDTRQYAKRQRTWFRHQLADADVVRLDPDAPNADAVAAAWWLGTPETIR